MKDIKGRILLEEDLRKNEAGYQMLFENTPEAVLLTTVDGVILNANPAACQMFSRAIDELCQNGLNGILDTNDPIFVEAIENRAHTGKLYGEFIGLGRDGKKFPVEVSSSVFTDIDGNELASIVIRNIAVRRKSEEDIKESESLLEVFFTQSSEGFFFMMLDEPVEWNETTDKDKTLEYVFAHQRVTKVNDALLDQYRATRENFLNLTPYDFFAHDLENGKKIWKQFFDSGKLHFESSERRFDGTQMYIEVDYVCVYDSRNRISGHFGIQRDVTERKLADKMLINSESRYRTHIQRTPLAAIECDREFRLTSWNPAAEEIFGFSGEEAIGKNAYLIVPDSKVFFVGKILQQVIDNGITSIHTLENKTKEGNIITCEWYYSPLFAADGTTTGMAAFAIDVTERIQAERSLKENEARLGDLNATKDKFFSIIAHDLKSPFNATMGYSTLLLEQIKVKDYDGIEEYAESIQKSSQRAMDLLKNLLEWSRSQTGRMSFNPEYLDMAPLINETMDLLSDSALQKSISITKKVPASVKVFADKDMINAVLRNLISNAVKFTHPGGMIQVSAEQQPDEWMISVKDNGVGIRKNDMEKLFKLEETHSTYGTQNEVGTGLGLLLSKEFVSKHGGKIWVESEAGKGSTFFFTIPRVSLLPRYKPNNFA
jgi:PAS domain S-box-containing protein